MSVVLAVSRIKGPDAQAALTHCMDIPKAAHELYTMTDRERLRLQVCWPQDIVRRGTEVREGDIIL